VLNTELNFLNYLFYDVLYYILSNISVNKTRSRIIGQANKVSSQTLYKTNVCVPPMKISDEYSSIAFFVSPVSGTYFITIS